MTKYLRNKLKGGKAYFGSRFRVFSSWLFNSIAFRPVTWEKHHEGEAWQRKDTHLLESGGREDGTGDKGKM